MDIRLSDFIVRDSSVRGILDPYTGNKLEIHGHVSGNSVVYNAPKAFTLSEPMASVTDVYARASMRNGVRGMVDGDARLVDAYTGERMSLRQTHDGKWYLHGGFNPRCARTSLAEFVRLASRGTVVLGEPAKAVSVPEETPEPEETPSVMEAAGETIEEMAEMMAHAIGADRGRTTVSMSTGKRRRK